MESQSNKVLFVAGETSCGQVVVMDTPMYPARYYAGLLWNGQVRDNATHLYYRTVEAAIDAADKMVRS